MKIFFQLLCAAICFASCSTAYNIKGTSDVQNLDGHILYLKTIIDDNVKNLDSCDVVHGQFSFKGTIDTVMIASLVVNDESIMPLVIEEGDITIKFNTAQQTSSGTPLNDTLSSFIERYNQITNQIADLQHQHDKAIMDGEDMISVTKNIQLKYEQLNAEYDKCVTSFIEENFDNILGPFVFQMATSTMDIPLTNAWIDALMSKATDKFKNDRYVKEFMDAAKRNQAIMTGMDEPAPEVPEATLPETAMPNADVPTPNELAKPAEEGSEQ